LPPAVTLARSLTTTFAGIRPQDVPAFVLAQCAGVLVALMLSRLLIPARVPTVASAADS
jgi:hypothetical protein